MLIERHETVHIDEPGQRLMLDGQPIEETTVTHYLVMLKVYQGHWDCVDTCKTLQRAKESILDRSESLGNPGSDCLIVRVAGLPV